MRNDHRFFNLTVHSHRIIIFSACGRLLLSLKFFVLFNYFFAVFEEIPSLTFEEANSHLTFKLPKSLNKGVMITAFHFNARSDKSLHFQRAVFCLCYWTDPALPNEFKNTLNTDIFELRVVKTKGNIKTFFFRLMVSHSFSCACVLASLQSLQNIPHG